MNEEKVESKRGRFTNLSAKAELIAILVGVAIASVTGIIVTYNHFAKSTQLEAVEQKFEVAAEERDEQTYAFSLETQKKFIDVEIGIERREVDRYQEKARDAERSLSRYEQRRVKTLEDNIMKLREGKMGLEHKISLEREMKERAKRGKRRWK